MFSLVDCSQIIVFELIISKDKLGDYLLLVGWNLIIFNVIIYKTNCSLYFSIPLSIRTNKFDSKV